MSYNVIEVKAVIHEIQFVYIKKDAIIILNKVIVYE